MSSLAVVVPILKETLVVLGVLPQAATRYDSHKRGTFLTFKKLALLMWKSDSCEVKVLMDWFKAFSEK